jgi:hypothetical protein
VFLDLGFAPKEAKRLLAHADAQMDESIRLKQQPMDDCRVDEGGERDAGGRSGSNSRYPTASF